MQITVEGKEKEEEVEGEAEDDLFCQQQQGGWVGLDQQR